MRVSTATDDGLADRRSGPRSAPELNATAAETLARAMDTDIPARTTSRDMEGTLCGRDVEGEGAGRGADAGRSAEQIETDTDWRRRT